MMYRSRYLHFVWGVSKVIATIWIYTVLIEHLHKMFSELISDQIFSHVRFSSIVLAILWIFSDRIRKWLAQKELYQCSAIVFWIAPLAGFYLVEIIYNPKIEQLTWLYALGNIVCLTGVLLCIYMICPSMKAAIVLYWSVLLIFALANYYVTQFRGNPFMPSDLFSVATAARVAGKYTFTISERLVIGILCYVWGIAIAGIVPYRKKKRSRRQQAVCILAFVGVVWYFRTHEIEAIYGFHLAEMQWDIGGVYQEKGSVLSFATMLQNFEVQKPAGYSGRRAEQILSQAQKQERDETDLQPTIIAIMDESFSDLRVLGDFETSEEYLDHWYAVEDYRLRGNLYVSTYAGGTANTEFEFLTGNSMGNLPAGIVPYQIYNLKNIGNMADILHANGYKTTAIHPEYKGNWTRTRVYESFGFDTFLSIDDFENPERIRSSVSDQASFEKVIEVYERDDGPQFIFNVTMQNHGGYDVNEMAKLNRIVLKEEWRGYTDVETYLTLIRESDQAICNLIEYFSNVDRPVILCIFGDHQPGVNGLWIEEVMGKETSQISFEEQQSKYCVPYMIWANFECAAPSEILDTSSNYLGALLLEQAGIVQTDYTAYLLQMREQVPIINAYGYQTADAVWHSFEEETQVTEWVENYKMVQYNAMFDAKRNKKHYRPAF